MRGASPRSWARPGSGILALVAVCVIALVLFAVHDNDPAISTTASDRANVEIVSQVAVSPMQSTAEHLACTAIDEPSNFPLYSVGRAFEDMPLTAVLRQCQDPAALGSGFRRGNSASFIYGNCDIPVGASRCAPPLEIQVWPACERQASDDDPATSLTERRGVPAAGVGTEMIEVYADSTIVVFSQDPALAKRAVKALTAFPSDRAPDALPLERQPAAGPLPAATQRADRKGCLS